MTSWRVRRQLCRDVCRCRFRCDVFVVVPWVDNERDYITIINRSIFHTSKFTPPLLYLRNTSCLLLPVQWNHGRGLLEKESPSALRFQFPISISDACVTSTQYKVWNSSIYGIGTSCEASVVALSIKLSCGCLFSVFVGVYRAHKLSNHGGMVP